jgi:hypothetical protein
VPGGALPRVVWAQSDDKMTLAAGRRAAWPLVKRRSDVRFELDQLHGNRWICDVDWLRFGKRRQRQRRVCGMQALPFSG